jgi:hypothetical protein
VLTVFQGAIGEGHQAPQRTSGAQKVDWDRARMRKGPELKELSATLGARVSFVYFLKLVGQ